MRVLIDNWVWLDKKQARDVDLFLIKKKLTLIPKKSGYEDPEDVPKILEMFRETDTHVGIPRYFYESTKTDQHEEVVNVSRGRPLSIIHNPISLRGEDQTPVVDLVERKLKARPWGGGVIEAYTSFGKTRCCLEIARRLGMSFAILVHKEPLMDQWIANIKTLLPGLSIGMVQSSKCDFEGKDVVIGMIQSFMDDGVKYPAELYQSFGLVISDEVHRQGSFCFSRAMPLFNAAYRIGVSGTVRRKDGCENAFTWTIGNVIAKAAETNRLKPIVYVRETGFQAVKKDYEDKKTGKIKEFDMNAFTKPTQLNFISGSKWRNNLIANDIIQSLRSDRSPLVLSERIEILNEVATRVVDRGFKELQRQITCGFYIGGRTKDELDAASKCNVVLATVQLAKEGIDIPRLDTLFLVTPQADVEQDAGRICRLYPNKKSPMIVDYLDSSLDNFKGIFYSRLRLYRRLGWEVIGLKL